MNKITIAKCSHNFEQSIKRYVVDKYCAGSTDCLEGNNLACYLCLAISASRIGTVRTEMLDIKKHLRLEEASPHDLVLKILEAQKKYPQIKNELCLLDIYSRI